MAPQKSLGVLKPQTKRGHPPAPRTLIPGPKIVIPDLIGDPENGLKPFPTCTFIPDSAIAI